MYDIPVSRIRSRSSRQNPAASTGECAIEDSELRLPLLPDLNYIDESNSMHSMQSSIEALSREFANALFLCHFSETIRQSRDNHWFSRDRSTVVRKRCRIATDSNHVLTQKSDWMGGLASDEISECRRILSVFIAGRQIDQELFRTLGALGDEIWSTRVQWFPMMFVDVAPLLILTKKVILLRMIEEEAPATFDLFLYYLTLIDGFLAHLCRIEACEKSMACFSFICDRLLEIGLHAQTSIHSIIMGLLRLQTGSCELHRRTVSLLENLFSCQHHMNKNTRASPQAFVSEIAEQLLEGALHSHDCIEQSVVELAAKLPDSHFPQLILIGSILRYFAEDSKSTKVFLSRLSKATADPWMIQRTLKFAVGEFSFVAMQRKSDILRDTSPSRVPRLLLENVSPTQNQDALAYEPVEASVFPLASSDLAPDFIQLVTGLIFRANKATLNEDVMDLYPTLNGKPAVLFHLLRFCDWLQFVSPSQVRDAHEMLKVVGHEVLGDLLFKVKEVSGLSLIGSGQFGAVYKSAMSQTAVKLIKVPLSEDDRCTFYAALNESLCQHLCSDQTSHCLSLISCGRTLEKDYFYIESPLLSGNLKSFRQQLPLELVDYRLKLQLMGIYSQIVKAVEFMHNKASIVHYDLKLDNILIDTGNYTLGTHPYFIPRIAVGDFGEARIVFQDDFCTKNRGTECIKSPEMISIARASRKDVPRYDRRRVIGTGRPSDIWSLGCLFYELMTGDFLFGDSDGDWLSFYYKLTDETKDLFEGLDLARKLDCDAFVEFTQFCLVRDPSRRPNIKSVAHKFSEMQAKVAQMAPREIIPCFHCRFPVASSFIEKYAHS